MKKTLLSIATVIAFGAATVLLTSGQDDGQLEACSNYDPLSKAGGGAAGGYAGDPANGSKNCANCHDGGTPNVPPATPMMDLITTNIPVTGYIPGTTYIITTYKSSPGIADFGFETAAQNASGTDLGTFTNIDVNETQLKTKTILSVPHIYVTHTSNSNTGAAERTYTYNWTAPVTGSGCVTFYGAFLEADGGGSTGGDVVYTSSTTVCESTVGIAQLATKTNISVYPTVSNGNFTVEVPNGGDYSVEIYNLTGEKVFEKTTNASVEHVSLDVTSGLYFVNIKKDNKNTIKKIVIQ